MFTDIAGYTALMQTDEPRAIAIRQRHREVFERQHAAYRGQIVQYYGDGTLSVFESAVDAVACAVAMQREFQEEPIVPLRIGLHTGDILITETEVIGDGVNLASRVESMAVPGAVLVSESVFDQIKNQPEFEGTSLGLFTFKNVTKPIEVFAIMNEGLQVPNPKNLEGKFLKRTSAEQTWLQRLPTGAKYVGGFLLFLLLAPFIYAPLTSLFEADASPHTVQFTDASGQTVTREIISREDRRKIYLGHFEVSPKDSAMAWASMGFPHALRFDFNQNPYLFVKLEEKKAETALSAQLSAAAAQESELLMRGTLGRKEDIYTAEVALHEVSSGKLQKRFTAQAPSLLALGDSVSRLAGPHWGLTPSQLSASPDLPLSEILTRVPAAYESYARGLYVAMQSRDPRFFFLMEQAVRLDSTFAWAAFSYANLLYYYQRRGEQLHQHLALATEHIDRMPELYSVYLRQLAYKVEGKNEKALQLLQLMAELEPGEESHWLQLVNESYNQSKYQLCLDAILQARELNQDPTYMQIQEARCLLWLGRSEEGLVVIDAYLRTHTNNQQAMLLKGQLLLAQGQLVQAKQLYQQGSLLFDNASSFEAMLAHCSYAEEPANMTKAQAAPFLGQYWVSSLTAFRFDLTYVLGYLAFQAPSQPRFLLYQMNDSTFGTVHNIRAGFRKGENGEVEYLKVYQGNQNNLRATPVKEEVAALFEAYRDEDFVRADSLIEPTLAVAPQDSFLRLMAMHLDFRQQPGYAQENENFENWIGIYEDSGQKFEVSQRDGRLYYMQIGNSQGFDPFLLYAFKPGNYFLLENMMAYVQFKPGVMVVQYLGRPSRKEIKRVREE